MAETQSLLSRLREGPGWALPHTPTVIPAKAGIQSGMRRALRPWTPACAGVTNLAKALTEAQGHGGLSRPCECRRALFVSSRETLPR